MRAKTVRPSSNIPVKRTSEGVETTRASKNENLINENAVNSAASEPVPAPVFPVKSILKKSEPGPQQKQQQQEQQAEVDKENINPIIGSNTIDWDDLDAEDAGDPLMVSDYVVEIFEYMKELEVNPLEYNIITNTNNISYRNK